MKCEKTVYDGKLWNCWIHCYNATFQWQIYNFLLKASVQTFVSNKEIKSKSGLYFCFLFLNWKVFRSKTFIIFFWCQRSPAEESSWRSGVLANVSYSGAAPGYIDRGGRIYIFVRIRARVAHARERVSARIYGWGPGARLRAPGGVQGQSPWRGSRGRSPRKLSVFRLSNPSNCYM